MKTKEAIEFLEIYFTKNRRRGHTTAMLNGAKSDKNIMVIVSDHQQKNNIDLPNKRMITINELDRLKGIQKPLLIDHYALQIIFYKILNLLKRGKKYEAIFNTILNWTMHDGEFIPYNALVDLEQKYFPKTKEREER